MRKSNQQQDESSPKKNVKAKASHFGAAFLFGEKLMIFIYINCNAVSGRLAALHTEKIKAQNKKTRRTEGYEC